MNTNEPAPVPVLPEELQRQVDLLAGLRFGDFLMTAPEPHFDPDAARYDEELRRALAPASPETIRAWLMIVVASLGPGAISPDVLCAALLLTCGDLPAACWTKDTAREIVRRHKFLPFAAEFDEVLQPVARKLRALLQALERIARADPATASQFRAGPAREAKGYELPPPPLELLGARPRRSA